MVKGMHHYEFGFAKTLRGSVKCSCKKRCFCGCGCMTQSKWLSKKMTHEPQSLKSICLKKISLEDLQQFCETKNIDINQLIK